MHPGQVVAFAEILDRQFPVAGDIEFEARVGAAVVEGLTLELAPAGEDGGGVILELGGGAGDVDEDHVAPDVGADFDEAQGGAVDLVMGVVAGAADMGGGLQIAVQGVAPGVIGAANDAADLALLFDQDHAPVAAGVLENADLALAVADGEERDAKEGDGVGVAGFGDVLGETDAGPGVEEHGLTFRLEGGVGGVVVVRQAARTVNRGQDGGEIGGHRYLPCFGKAWRQRWAVVQPKGDMGDVAVRQH